MANPGFFSLYVHFPFCRQKCHYCDFYSVGGSSIDVSPFVSAVTAEWQQWTSFHQNQPLKTIYFGGGTPSLLSPLDMARIVRALKIPTAARDLEWTIEVNPATVDQQSLKDYRDLGINRLSIGVQSLAPRLLQKLGRIHTEKEARTAIEAAFAAGFSNVSVDLLCGVPGQSDEQLEADLETLLGYPITHLSCYLLTLSPDHPLAPELPAEEKQLEHLLLLDQVLEKHGFEHYEISNFAKPEFQSRHNRAYWSGTSYLGLGPSAHSYDAERGRRWKNHSDLALYTDRISQGLRPVEWEETLSDLQKQREAWLLALRLSDGFPATWLRTEQQRARAQALEKEGLLRNHPQLPGRLQLTPRGFALSDQILGALSD